MNPKAKRKPKATSNRVSAARSKRAKKPAVPVFAAEPIERGGVSEAPMAPSRSPREASDALAIFLAKGRGRVTRTFWQWARDFFRGRP